MNNRKVPGFVLSTFLFLFFYLLIRTVYQDLFSKYYDIMDATVQRMNRLFSASFWHALILLCFACLFGA